MASDRSGQRFGPYLLQALLGRGGMGEVYRALDTEKDRVVAVKLLPPHLAQDPSYQARFQREAHAAAHVQSPNIVPIHTFGSIEGVLFIEMAFIDGEDLGSLIRSRGPLEPRQAVSVIGQIASALDAAHAAGLVHRDVKPANIMVSGGHAYLSDFGIASGRGDTRITSTGVAIGSFAYMAPERFTDDQQLTGAVDTYALGCVLFECLTGEPPYPATSQHALLEAHLHGEPRPVSQVRPGLPAALDAVIARCLAKRPTDRYPSARAFAQAAREALPSPSYAGGSGSVWKRWAIPALVAAVCIGLIAGMLVNRFAGSDDPPAQAVQLIPADQTPPERFTASAVTQRPSDVLKQSHVRADGSSGGATATTAAAPLVPQTSRGGDAGLYGREGDESACDSSRLIEMLMAEPAVAKAWAQLQGVTVEQIPATIKSWTSVLLRHDTYVTNTIYKGGRAESYPAILQAGTAVLVDRNGVPRTKCNCGNPLLPPPPADGRQVVGAAWKGYSPSRTRVVRPSVAALSSFTVADIVTGATRAVPAGGAARPADVTAATLQTAQVPAACQASAQRLVGGKAPKPFGGGLGQISDKVVYADIAGIGYKQGLFAYDCSAGGVSWPQVLVLTGDKGELLGSLDLGQRDRKEHADVTSMTVRGNVVDLVWKSYEGAGFDIVEHRSQVTYAGGRLSLTDAPASASPTSAAARPKRPTPAMLSAAMRRSAQSSGSASQYPPGMYDCMGQKMYDSQSTDSALWAFVDDPTTERDIPGTDESGAQDAVITCMMQSGGGPT
ncbi:serine/threonine-protein kinase [Luteipulveratus halotolerans]|uniref:serine/threonine-protein kinase n=1 Tax=Luteipulveratus halotolerans TaxID=1631356 RepID=UPI00068016C6|nr:serine/threonine-protein kinase [Luteipulveratus halotolerans]